MRRQAAYLTLAIAEYSAMKTRTHAVHDGLGDALCDGAA
jgi:hypothetical protein